MVLTDNNVAYWKFDTNNTTQPDSTGNGNTLTVNGATFNASGIFNGDYSYDGTNDYMDGGASILSGVTGAFSISFWFNTAVVDADETFFSKDDRNAGNMMFQIQLDVSGSGRIIAYVWDDSAGGYLGKSSSTPATSTDNHVVMVYDGGTDANTSLKLWLNDVEQSTNFSGGSFSGIDNTAANFLVGKYIPSGGNPARFYDGSLDEGSVWTRALTDAEVSELYNSGVPLQYPYSEEPVEEDNNALFFGNNF